MPKFVPRERKHKVRARQNGGGLGARSQISNTNTAEIQSEAPSERDLRRKALLEELQSQPSVKSRKKQKRLEKYIVRELCKILVPQCLILSSGQKIAERRKSCFDKEISRWQD